MTVALDCHPEAHTRAGPMLMGPVQVSLLGAALDVDLAAI